MGLELACFLVHICKDYTKYRTIMLLVPEMYSLTFPVVRVNVRFLAARLFFYDLMKVNESMHDKLGLNFP